MNLSKDITREFLFDCLDIVQPAKGYRFSVDSIDLCAYLQDQSANDVLDIGSGCGIISLILSRLKGFKKFTCIEIQEELHKCSEINIKNANLEDRVTLIHGSIYDYKQLFKGRKFDLVVSNPPFYKEASGLLNPNLSRAIARHEIHLCMKLLLKISHFLLSNNGRLAVIYPVNRLIDLVQNSIIMNFPIISISFIHPSQDRPAESFIAVLKKRNIPKIKITAPIYIHETDSKIHGKEIRDLISKIKDYEGV